MRGNPKLRAALAVLAAAVASAALAAPASAGVLVKSATDCDAPVTSQPFARFGDNSSYKLVGDGGFEYGAADWTLSGGAKVVAGNEAYDVHGAGDGYSLSLPAGSSATSPTVCVGLDEPTLRFFVRKNSGLLSTMAVSVKVETSLGLVATVPIGVDLGGNWHPSLPMLMLGNLLPLLPGDKTPVQFQFTPLLGGNWQVDDVYVDPWRRI
jgi:opacity protein-like surface antigen